jgi:hypothetical protein
MNKAELIVAAVELGLDGSGTKQQLKERLEAYRLKPQPVESAVVEESSARKAYRMSAKQPKVRKGPRNLQVEK